jgi:two-component system cell cycle sensor histidine kinase/response regulator CckA
LSALKIAHAEHPDLPLIFVSGTLGEDRAVEALKSGATDYILKEGVSRLVPAVRRAMQEVEEKAERRRLEVQLIEGQKMDVVGQLAGGVAHDFNNLLSVIIGYCHLLKSDLAPESLQLKYAEEIRHASERAAGLTRQLLVFSRKQTVQPVSLNLNDVVNDMGQLLRRLIDANIEMTFDLGDEIGCIQADSGYVGQVLMNLVVNARDAMPYGGKLIVATRNKMLDEKDADPKTGASPGDYVVLSVSDTGTGMTEEVQARLFEPLFTTKPAGKGTGLGLVTCRNIILQSGGHISFHSECGQGSRFCVYFPRKVGQVESPTQPCSSEGVGMGTETILVVDDEPTVRNLARVVLETYGYTVLDASNGEEAVRMVREFEGPRIKLVFTDVIMPLMGGRAIADLLEMTNPEIRILFTSGYSDDAITQYGVLESGVEFLPKPYTPAMLARKVRELLDLPVRANPTGISS